MSLTAFVISWSYIFVVCAALCSVRWQVSISVICRIMSTLDRSNYFQYIVGFSEGVPSAPVKKPWASFSS